MFKRMLFGGFCVVSAIAAISATVFAASNLSERIEGERMTVLKTDVAMGRFQCVEHRSWTPVVSSDLKGVHPGDIVRVQSQASGEIRLVVLRTAYECVQQPIQRVVESEQILRYERVVERV